MAYQDERTKKLCRQFSDAQDRRRNWENLWQEIADHALMRRDFTVKREPGRQRGVRVYDTTSRDSNNLLAAALHSLLTNPATRWFDLRYMSEDLNEMDEAVWYLDQIKTLALNAFSRPQSGFTTQIAEVYNDLPGFGTGVMFIQEDIEHGPKFVSRPLSETFIDVDESGRIAVVFRNFQMRAWQAIEFFGEDDLPEKIVKAAKADSNQEFEFLHIVQRRALPIPGNLDASGMPWESVYISMDGKDIVREGGFWENPYMVARWTVDAGEIYGRGPGVDALPEQKMLNAMWRTYIRNAEKAVDPPLLVDDDGVLPGSQLRVTPSSQIVVRNDGGGGDPVRYLESRAQFPWASDIIESRSRKIEKAFHSEIIQAFQDPRMTATQVIELARLSQRILSPVLGRMQVELLEPMIERVIGILSRRPDFPAPPDFLGGEELKIEYVSPVARAQKASESQAILDSFSAAAAVSEADPSVMDNVDLDVAIRKIFEGNGVPVQVLRQRDDVAEIREAQAQLAEQQQQQEQMAQGGDTIAKLLPGIAKLSEMPG